MNKDSIFFTHHNCKNTDKLTNKIRQNPRINQNLDLRYENSREKNLSYMPGFYGKVLTATLKQAVEQSLELPVEDQLNLFEELAIIRNLACTSLEIYKKVEENVEFAKENPGKHNQEKFTATQLVRQALTSVSDFCEKAAKIDALQRDKYSIHTINSIVAQIAEIIYEVLEIRENRPDLAVTIEKAIREKLRIPVQTVKLIEKRDGLQQEIGTKLTPDIIDADVLNMDDSVPPVEE